MSYESVPSSIMNPAYLKKKKTQKTTTKKSHALAVPYKTHPN
jgi:hypothetical protein